MFCSHVWEGTEPQSIGLGAKVPNQAGNRMESLHGADLDAVANEFARAVVAGRAYDHLIALQQADSNRP